MEGTWGLPEIYPFAATFRVVFEDAVVENADGKFLLYIDAGVEEIVIEKKQLAGQVEGGNIFDLAVTTMNWFISEREQRSRSPLTRQLWSMQQLP